MFDWPGCLSRTIRPALSIFGRAAFSSAPVRPGSSCPLPGAAMKSQSLKVTPARSPSACRSTWSTQRARSAETRRGESPEASRCLRASPTWSIQVATSPATWRIRLALGRPATTSFLCCGREGLDQVTSPYPRGPRLLVWVVFVSNGPAFKKEGTTFFSSRICSSSRISSAMA